MMHKAWSSMEEVSYCFWRSSVKFQGHIALKIVEFDSNWAFPDCNSSLNSPMAMKCCTKLETAKKRCPIVFQGHPSNFKVTRDKTSPILTQIGRFRTIGQSQLSNPSDLPCSSGWHIFAAWDFVSVLGFSEENLDLFCKLLQSLFLQWFVNLVVVKPNQSINCLWATAHANTLAKWYVDAKLLHLPTCGPINGLSILWSMAEGGVVLLMPWCIYLVWPITGFL